MKKRKVNPLKTGYFIMSKIAAIFYSILLIGSAVMIHLIVNEFIHFRTEWIYIIIGLLIGSGIILLLQSFLKKI